MAGLQAQLARPPFIGLWSRIRGFDRAHLIDAIARRLEVARNEVAAVAEYDYVVINDEVEPAVGRLCCIVQAERARRARMGPVASEIIDTFRA